MHEQAVCFEKSGKKNFFKTVLKKIWLTVNSNYY